MDIDFTVAQIAKISLEENETLLVTVKSEGMPYSGYKAFQKALATQFGEGRVMLIVTGEHDDIKYTKVEAK